MEYKKSGLYKYCPKLIEIIELTQNPNKIVLRSRIESFSSVEYNFNTIQDVLEYLNWLDSNYCSFHKEISNIKEIIKNTFTDDEEEEEMELRLVKGVVYENVDLNRMKELTIDGIISSDDIRRESSDLVKETMKMAGCSESEAVDFYKNCSTIESLTRPNGSTNMNMIIPRECISIELQTALDPVDIAKNLHETYMNKFCEEHKPKQPEPDKRAIGDVHVYVSGSVNPDLKSLLGTLFGEDSIDVVDFSEMRRNHDFKFR